MSSRRGDVRTQRIEGKNENWIRGEEGRGRREKEEEEKDPNYVKNIEIVKQGFGARVSTSTLGTLFRNLE